MRAACDVYDPIGAGVGFVVNELDIILSDHVRLKFAGRIGCFLRRFPMTAKMAL